MLGGDDSKAQKAVVAMQPCGRRVDIVKEWLNHAHSIAKAEQGKEAWEPWRGSSFEGEGSVQATLIPVCAECRCW